MLAAKSAFTSDCLILFSLLQIKNKQPQYLFFLLLLPPVPARFPGPSPSVLSRLPLVRSSYSLHAAVCLNETLRVPFPPAVSCDFIIWSLVSAPPPPRTIFLLEVIFFRSGMNGVKIGAGNPSGFFFPCTLTPTVTRQPRASPAETEQTVIAIDCCCAEDVFSLLGLLRGLVSLGEG